MKQYILLDWDGNLAKTLDIWLEAFRVALKNQGVAKTDKEIGASFGLPFHYLELWGVADPERVVADADKLARTMLPSVDLYPDALEVLHTLKTKGKKLALITTSSREHIHHLLLKHGLSETFDVIITSDDTQKHKPDPEPLELALKRLNGTKAEAVMIGDSDKDLGAAHNAGIDSILFYPAEHEKFYDIDRLRELTPTHIVEDFRDVLGLLGI